MTIEQAIEKSVGYMAPLLKEHNDLSPTRGLVWTLKELEERSGASARVLGKARKSFTRAWAQALTPGQERIYSVQPTTIYGKVGIAVHGLA